MGSFTWKNVLPRLGFELADLNCCPLSLCAFMYVNGGTCWLWPHFPLCLESLTGWGHVTLSFFSLLEVLVYWAHRLVCGVLLGTMSALIPLFPPYASSWEGSAKVASSGVIDGHWSHRQPLSPLEFGFRRCGTFECQLAPKGSGLLCPLMPPDKLNLPHSRKHLLLLGKKVCFRD